MPESDDRPFELQSLSVQRVRLGIARWLGRAAGVSLLGSVALLLVEVLLKAMGVGWLAFWSSWTRDAGGWPYLLALISGVLSLIVASRGVSTRAAARVTVSPEGLWIRRRRRVRFFVRERIVDGLVVGAGIGAGVELHLRGGDTMTIRTDAEAEADRILDVLGIGVDRRRTIVALGGPSRPLVAGCLGFVVMSFALMFALIFASTSVRHFGFTFPVVLLLLIVSTLAIARTFRAAEVSVGTDGVKIRGAWRTRFFPYAIVEAASATSTHLVLSVRSDGERRDVSVRSGDSSLLDGLADRITRAMRRRGEAELTARAELLDPRGQPLEAWRAAIASLVHGEHGYRGRSLSEDDLLAVLDDPEAPAGRRIGAAIGLRSGGETASHERIRIAADACASDPLRDALAKAAADELDDATLEQALAEAGAAVKKA